MTRDQVVTELNERFGNDIVEILDRSQKRLYVEIKPDALTPVASYIFREKGARFHIASGMDARKHFEILYHFSIEDLNLLVSLRVKLDKSDPKVDSLTPVFRGVNWIEREMSELLGIEFVGHPDMRRLLLSEEWPQDSYPLRQDFKDWDESAVRDRGV